MDDFEQRLLAKMNELNGNFEGLKAFTHSIRSETDLAVKAKMIDAIRSHWDKFNSISREIELIKQEFSNDPKVT